MQTLKTLSAEMNVTEADLAGFVECLRVWMSKGYSMEEAISKHMAQMTKLAENALAFPQSLAVDAFFPA